MVRACGWIHFSLRVDKWHCTSTVLVPILFRVRYSTVPAPFGLLPFCLAFAPQRHKKSTRFQMQLGNRYGTAPVWVYHIVLNQWETSKHYSPHILQHILFICCNRYKNVPVHFFVCFHDGDGTQQGGEGTPATNPMLESFICLKSDFSSSHFADN